MLEVVIATKNRHKVRELKRLLAVPGIRWRSLAEYPRARPVRETGKTFRENAIKKAAAAARIAGASAIADDSGITIEALGGAPGVCSARFAGRHGDDAANNDKVLQLLEGLPSSRRHASYRCVLALADHRGVVTVTEGVWSGRIATAPNGRHGFGYDPIFVVERLGKTAAQIPPSVKNRLSHRAKAARAMRRALLKYLATYRDSCSGSSS